MMDDQIMSTRELTSIITRGLLIFAIGAAGIVGLWMGYRAVFVPPFPIPQTDIERITRLEFASSSLEGERQKLINNDPEAKALNDAFMESKKKISEISAIWKSAHPDYVAMRKEMAELEPFTHRERTGGMGQVSEAIRDAGADFFQIMAERWSDGIDRVLHVPTPTGSAVKAGLNAVAASAASLDPRWDAHNKERRYYQLSKESEKEYESLSSQPDYQEAINERKSKAIAARTYFCAHDPLFDRYLKERDWLATREWSYHNSIIFGYASYVNTHDPSKEKK